MMAGAGPQECTQTESGRWVHLTVQGETLTFARRDRMERRGTRGGYAVFACEWKKER